MTICSFETPTFNIISGTFYISQKKCNKWQIFGSQIFTHKNYNRKHDFS